ncbi:cupin-like domain-containing protein [Pelagibacterium halotolerans]|uniref:cupin-like domain-containing protein n=1 Tax=Pelagibacterium halotolerans TaxID=531813 RepID=UPI0038513DB3
MNIAYPKADFETDRAAIDGFADLLKSGFENPEGIRGTVRITIPEYRDQDFIARYDDQLLIERHDMERETDTQVSIPIGTIHRIFNEFEVLDWRDPDIIGTITFTGNLAFANHLAKSCIRPSNWTMARFRGAERRHAAKGYRELTEIEYLNRPTQRQILEVMKEARPVVITGLEPTPPCRDWTIDKLAERYGDAVVRVRSATHRQTMAEFVAELKAFQANPYDNMIEGFVKPYTEGANLPDEMWADFGPLFFDREDFIPPQLWLGAVPTHIPTSSLHRDPLTGFLLQVIGRKRLDLYSADQAELLYPMKSYNNYQPCWFKPEAPDYDIYPKARDARCISVTLNPGELIVQPAGWFHQVYAEDSPNMSVSYFWRY